MYTSSDTLEPGFILPHPKGYIYLGLAWSGMRCSSSNLFDPVGVLTVRRSSVFCSLFSLLISVFHSCNPSLFGSWFFSRPRKDQFLLIGVPSWAPHCSSSVIHSSQSFSRTDNCVGSLPLEVQSIILEVGRTTASIELILFTCPHKCMHQQLLSLIPFPN